MIRPVATWFDPERNVTVYLLAPEDEAVVRQGYACSNCLEDFRPLCLPKCPLCGEEIVITVDKPAKQLLEMA